MFKPTDLFDLERTDHAGLFTGCEYAWSALAQLKDYLLGWLSPEPRHYQFDQAFVGERVFIGDGTVVEAGAMIKGPAIIGRNCQVRHNAYVREHVIVGDDCVIGNACELKNAILFNGCQVPHFNYVGDSILGYRAHLGAGVKISNVKLVSGTVQVIHEGKALDTGLRKFGALLGDEAEVGCNAVLNPGSVLGRQSVVYPNVSWRGVLPARMVAKGRWVLEVVPRRV
jgi:UDP-N-acetylglucosamine diphosphorylase / glucose-1-phosphate thymidylyltransferase / UDP-N-acetylgalactosamine diphosphorylase / glucosamine-1-phosphate N-acetyltransferase / galactosamine-1-phosphate N-acetyltransferase